MAAKTTGKVQAKSAARRGSRQARGNGRQNERENRNARPGAAARGRGAAQRDGGNAPAPRTAATDRVPTLVESAKDHPLTAVALSAAAGLLAIQGVRLALAATVFNEPEGRQGGRGRRSRHGLTDRLREGVSTIGEYGRDGLAWAGSALEEAASTTRRITEQGAEAVGEAAAAVGGSARRKAMALGSVAQDGYQSGRRYAAGGVENHPLVVCAAALAIGAGVGLLLPPTPLEDRLLGKRSDSVTGRLTAAGREMLTQGKDLVTKAAADAASATAREADRMGLTPTRLGKKAKRLAGTVRSAITHAVEGE